MQLLSPSFKDNQDIPPQFTCVGENYNPPLTISGVSVHTKSLALIMHDPDAPRGDFTHWLVWNIDPTTQQILEDSAPTGAAEGLNDFGKVGYGGPCPPPGTGRHRYVFELFALDIALDLPPTTTVHDLRKAMANHQLASAKLTGKMSGQTKQ